MRAVLLLAGVAAGVGIGYALWEEGDVRDRAAERSAAAPDVEAPAVETPAPERPAPRGDGVVEGSVILDDGTPLPGVDVIAVPKWDGTYDDPRGGTLAEHDARFRRSADDLLVHVRDRGHAVTGEDGRVRIEGLGPGRHYLRAFRKDWEIKRAPGQEHFVVPDASVEFLAARVYRIDVDVLLPDGSRPPHAQFQVSGAKMSRGAWWTPASPVLDFGAGRYKLTVSAGNRLEYQADAKEIIVAPDTVPERLVFRLRARYGFRGRVRLPEELSVRDVDVRLLWTRFEGEPPDRSSFVASHRGAHLDDGAFTVLDLEPGRYLLGLALANSVITRTWTVDLGHDVMDLELVVPPLDRAEHVHVRVFAHDGRPAPETEVQLAHTAEDGTLAMGSRGLPLKDGSFLIRRTDWDTDRLGPVSGYRETVRAKGPWGSAEADVFEGSALLHLAEPLRLTVVVEGYDASPLKGRLRCSVPRAGVWADELAEGGRSREYVMQPGTVLVRLELSSGPLEAIPNARRAVALPSGPATLAVPVPRLHRLVVRAREKVLLQGDDFWLQRAPGEDGRARFEELPAGRYTVSAGEHKATVDVPAQADIRLP